MKSISRGRTLMTNLTRKWTAEQIEANDKIEKSMLFTEFNLLDSGKSREVVCTMNVHHPMYEEYVNLFEFAPTMLYLLQSVYKGKMSIVELNNILSTQSHFHKANNEKIN